MAGKKKIELFVEVHNEKEFESIIRSNMHRLICKFLIQKHLCYKLICRQVLLAIAAVIIGVATGAEIFSYAFGSCTALDRLFTIIKLDWSDGKIILLKVPTDEISSLQRFKDQSQPVYVFILNGKVTKVFRGVDMVRFGEVAKKQIMYFHQEQSGLDLERRFYELDEPTPDEMEWMAARVRDREKEQKSTVSRRKARQAVRKRHRAELMVPHLTDLNFVLYWPHCLHAHPELYERWDTNNIVMVGRELIDITDEMAADIFYEGDAPLNEASLHKLKSGSALALCLRLLDSQETSFAKLTRRILYQEIRVAPHDETKPIEGDLPLVTAFNYYKSNSPTKEEILRRRQQEKEKRKEEHKEKRRRMLSEMQRVARQAIEEAVLAKRMEREQHKLELLKSGDLDALEKFKAEPEDEEVDIPIPEEIEGSSSPSSSDDEADEYHPPPGLLIPGFYAPPNDIAKVNGLAMLFPKLVRERVIPQPECLPPHVLVMLELHKLHRAIAAIRHYKYAVLHMGIFKASCPYDSVHIAYTAKQFDTLYRNSWNLDDLKLAFMLSVEKDVPLLQLVDLNPYYVSRDASIGEDECAAMFSVDYGDHYDQFEDFL